MRFPLRVRAQLIALTVLWVALYDDISVANVLGGLLVAAVVISVAPRDDGEAPFAHLSFFPAVWYVLLLIWKLLESNLKLAWEILRPHPRLHTGIFAVPMRGRSDGVATIVANSITLTPGTLTVEVDRNGDDVTLYVHGMFTHDVEAVRREVLQLESRALRAFGTAEEAEYAARAIERHDEGVQRQREDEP